MSSQIFNTMDSQKVDPDRLAPITTSCEPVDLADESSTISHLPHPPYTPTEWGSEDGREDIPLIDEKSQTWGSELSMEDGQHTHKPSPAKVTWMSLPRKDQLFILFLCRFVDFFQVASLNAYMFHQLKSFNPSLSDATIATQTGILQGSFTAAQVCTAMLWGRVADAQWGGRKKVLLIGLIGTGISCMGLGFSKSFAAAVVFRILGGGINGTVGTIRTMIAETVKERRFQSRAFLILPLSFNIASLVGPILGGFMSDPVEAYPRLFGAHSIFGGQDGVGWMKATPYAFPNLLSSFLLFGAAIVVFFHLEETLLSRKNVFDLGRHLGQKFRDFFCVPTSHPYNRLTTDFANSDTMLDVPESSTLSTFSESFELAEKRVTPVMKPKLPFRQIFTKNVIFTLVAQSLFDFHMGAFASLWILFLSAPSVTFTSAPSPLFFTGGLGMTPQTVGLATSIIGAVGIFSQLLIYPPVHARLGTMRSYRWSLLVFPIAYFLAPYMALIPSAAKSDGNGPFVWLSIALVLFLHTAARTFALPASIILLNNCTPHPSALATMHGIGQSTSAAFRTLGPVVAGGWFGYGLQAGMVGLGWWAVALVAIVGVFASLPMYEGSGHEIVLPEEVEGGLAEST